MHFSFFFNLDFRVLLCILTTSYYLLLLLGPYCFCPLLCPFAWNFPLVSLIFLKRSLVFPILFFFPILFPLYLCLVHQGDFLISPCHFLELCTEMGIFSFSSLPFASLLYSAICNAFSDNHFAYLHFFFLWMVLIFTSCTILWSLSVVLQALYIRYNPLNLFVTYPI